MASSGNPKAAALVETQTTILQKQTERECQPYFVDLKTLANDQRRSLQDLGLLKKGEAGNESVQLLREKHRRYLESVWRKPLKAPFVSLDSSRPWMLYWCLHAYDLLSSSPAMEDSERIWITDEDGESMMNTLEDCWQGYYTAHHDIPEIVKEGHSMGENVGDEMYFVIHEDDKGRSENSNHKTSTTPGYYCGGFGGGPGQMAHAATTYAAVLSLCILATSEKSSEDDDDDSDPQNDEYRSLHYSLRARKMLQEIRIPLYRWMVSLQTPSGGYRMQHDGEIDVRATYTIVCCSKLLSLLEKAVLGNSNVVNYLRSCQTYEGGIGGEPFSEAHGGYTFCAAAALQLLGKLHTHEPSKNEPDPFDVSALIGWLTRRQGSYEGGFSGRSNKLVDGCYSFWQGGAIAIASSASPVECGEMVNNRDPWLQQYRDSIQSDSSHSLPFPLLYDVFLLERYILLCAQEVTGGLRDKPSKARDFYHTCYNLSGLSVSQHCGNGNHHYDADDSSEGGSDVGFGDPVQTLVHQTHPCYNIRVDRVAKILDLSW